MKSGYLSEYFTGVAAKKLSQVEINPDKSNQHEFQGIKKLREILGTDKKTFSARFIYFGEDAEDTLIVEDTVTWYDAREKQPHRSPEFRLYFPAAATSITEKAESGDLLIIGRRPDESISVIIAQGNSTIENQLLWLFGIEQGDGSLYNKFTVKEIGKGISLNYTEKIILQQIGIEIEDQDESFLELLLKQFSTGFPSTRIFSEFSRGTLKDVCPIKDPDQALWKWMEREEVLFKTLEKYVVGARLRQGFADDVDGFIEFSLSVQNRRKSRVGYAFENHLEKIFMDNGIKYSRNKVTENNSKPDFIFPGIREYHDTKYPNERLTMLGVKTTCKDRWRQVLAEAERVSSKHLATLEPGISINQTNEMKAVNLNLVLPKSLHETYMESQKAVLLSLSDFILFVRQKQT